MQPCRFFDVLFLELGLAKPSGIKKILKTIDKEVGLRDNVEISMEVRRFSQ